MRLDQIQRAVLEDPDRINHLEDDRSLNHVRTEVRALQQAMLDALVSELDREKQMLVRAGQLLDSWQSESELKDILTLDMHRRQGLLEQINRCEGYVQLKNLIEQIRAERERVFNKYLGYFEGQQKDMENRKEETQKKLKPLGPKMDEWRIRREMLTQQQQYVNYYFQQSTHYLVVGMGTMMALALAGSFAPIWAGWMWGLLMGSTVFSYLSSRYAYVTGQPMQDLYDFLVTRYPVKNVKPFFRYEDKENAELPTRFDATRGDVLSQILQKDIQAAGSEFGIVERQRGEYLSYLQFLEGRKQWAADQISKMDRFSIPVPPVREEPVVVVETATGELAEIPPPEAFEPIPEVPPAPEPPPSRNERRKARPAKAPERAS
ncbi:MAG TPA: hypothetical protein V6D23_07195 [Candidatus Obscuribacterales bacterium]